MDIVNLLAGEGGSTFSPDINMDIDTSNLVDTLKGSYSDKKVEDKPEQTKKGLMKHFNDTVDSILSLLAERETKESKLFSQISSITNNFSSSSVNNNSGSSVNNSSSVNSSSSMNNNDSSVVNSNIETELGDYISMAKNQELINNVTKIAKTIVKSPSDKLREEDDAKDDATEIITDSLYNVLEESETIASIDSSLMDLNTKIGEVKPEPMADPSSILMDINTLLGGIPGKVIAGVLPVIMKPLTKVFAMLGAIPGVKAIKDLAVKAVSKLPGISTIKTLAKDIASKFTGKAAEKVVAKAGVKTVSEVGAKTLAKEGTELFVKKAAEKSVAKVATKGVLKSFLKKIPVVGALMGLGFAIPRVMSGDYKGASLEFASGLASTIPGVGTAASLGIDAALFARDMTTKTDVSKVDLDISANKSKQIIDKASPSQVINENTNINYNNSNVRNVSLENREEDFVRASKF